MWDRTVRDRAQLWKKIGSWLLVIALLVPSAGIVNAAPDIQDEQESQVAFDLHVSSSGNLERGTPLASQGVLSSGTRIFVTPAEGIARVRFFIDPATGELEGGMVGAEAATVDTDAPFVLDQDRLGPETIADGAHVFAAAIDLADGGTALVVRRAVVHNGAPALLLTSTPMRFTISAGASADKPLSLLTSDGQPAAYSLLADVPWLSFPAARPGGKAGMGTAPAVATLRIDASDLAPGTHTGTISASAPGFAPATAQITLDVTGGEVQAAAECFPVACSEILIDLPYVLNFNQDHGGVDDANGVGTGFTYVDQPTNGAGYLPANLVVDTSGPGTLNITTNGGIMYEAVNSQDNALAVGIDAPSQVTVMETKLVDLPAPTGNYEQAGLWFGNNEDNYVKLVVISEPGAVRIQYLLEVGGQLSSMNVSGAINTAGATLSLRLRANPMDRSIAAFYSLNNGAFSQLGQHIVPGELFSFDAAGIDPVIGTRSFGGVFATDRFLQGTTQYKFDSFSVISGGSPADPGLIEFSRSSFPLSLPTAMAWGPDGRLYVTEMFGDIHRITLDSAHQVVADESFSPIGSRLTLGLAVDPASTPGNVILWVSHSSSNPDAGEVNSGTITRVSGSNLDVVQNVITGLPRALANHATNAIHFGPDGKLYIAQGGNTGAGAPNPAATEFGTRAEQPLSAALLVADVKAAGFDGQCATPEGASGPAPCDVQTFATGLRNMYDFVIHSNGSIYGPDNGLGVVGTFPPSPTAPCTNLANPTSWTQGGHNPGPQPDLFHRIEQGKYYGHPNPYRQECVFKDGSYQGVAPLPNYVAPLHTIGMNTSSNGTIEYKANLFGGLLKGSILVANYSVGDNIIQIKLASNGTAVESVTQLVGGFKDPLPLLEGANGEIYVGEFGANQITVLVPTAVRAIGTWQTKAPMPKSLLDAGGAAIGNKLYVVAGKLGLGGGDTYQRSLYIYDATANAWSTGADLPAGYPAVENPAAAVLGGKLYLFGGSTAPFSGAVTNAAVYDPATNAWTELAPMPLGRGGASAQVLNGKIYVIGGMDAGGASLASVAVYDPATNAWGAAADMQERRDNPGSAALNGKLYVFGGRTRNADGTEINGILNSVEMYDPTTNTWQLRAPMPTGRRTVVVGTLGGKAQVMGGERTPLNGTFPQNEEYDPVTDSWRTLAPMPTPRHGAVAGVINNVVYVVGGGPTGGSSYSAVNEAFSFGPHVGAYRLYLPVIAR